MCNACTPSLMIKVNFPVIYHVTNITLTIPKLRRERWDGKGREGKGKLGTYCTHENPATETIWSLFAAILLSSIYKTGAIFLILVVNGEKLLNTARAKRILTTEHQFLLQKIKFSENNKHITERNPELHGCWNLKILFYKFIKAVQNLS